MTATTAAASAASESKLNEAREHIRNAENSLKTSFFKWTSDYATAADEYNQAAIIYRNLKQYEQSRDSYIKSSECYRNNQLLFNAARSLEQAILMSKECGDKTKIPELADKACRLYKDNGTFDSAISCLEKTSTFIEDINLTNAVYFLNQAAELSYVQSNLHKAAEFKNRVAKHYITLKMYKDAVDALRTEVQYNLESGYTNTIGRTTFGLVLLQLALEDVVAARKCLNENSEYCDPKDLALLKNLLDSFENEDRDTIVLILKDSFIQHMDVEFAHLAKIIPLPKSEKTKTQGLCDMKSTSDDNFC